MLEDATYINASVNTWMEKAKHGGGCLKMQFPPNALDDDNNDILPMAHFANELSNQVVRHNEKSVD